MRRAAAVAVLLLASALVCACQPGAMKKDPPDLETECKNKPSMPACAGLHDDWWNRDGAYR